MQKDFFFFGVRLIANSISANPCSPSMAAFMNRLPSNAGPRGGDDRRKESKVDHRKESEI